MNEQEVRESVGQPSRIPLSYKTPKTNPWEVVFVSWVLITAITGYAWLWYMAGQWLWAR